MLYPHAFIEGGRNSIVAHTRDFIPATSDIVFDAVPGTGRVHIVVSRRPLAGVPAGEELTEAQPHALAEVRGQLLGAETALVEYSLGAEHSYLWAATAEGVTLHRPPPRCATPASA